MSRRRNVAVGDIAPEDRVRPVLVCAPFVTHDGYFARPGDTLLMTPDEIVDRVAAHQVHALAGHARRRLRRLIRRAP